MSHQEVREHFNKVDPVIHGVMVKLDFDEWIKPRPKKKKAIDFFRALCREIIGQQLAGKAANAIFSRFLDLFKNRKIDPKKLLGLEDKALREVGMSWAKAKYVKNIAEAFLKENVAFDKLDQLSDEEVISQLVQIKGIGRWTAEMFLIFTLGREDVFSHGDLGLRRGIEKVYKLKEPTKEKIERIITPWSPYKSYGSIALWHSLDNG